MVKPELPPRFSELYTLPKVPKLLKTPLQAEIKALAYLHISPLRHAHNHESI